ncbi:hypothetical protein JXB01_02615 [Candidatus Micrarchaeota archaeon]|nr:hypothetical protein [Candidatus Micrarchaeota archaeon]
MAPLDINRLNKFFQPALEPLGVKIIWNTYYTLKSAFQTHKSFSTNNFRNEKPLDPDRFS